MREIAKGTNCTLRISVSDVGKIQNAKKIDTHIVSPSGVVSCAGNAYDELVQKVIVSIDGTFLNEVGPYSVNMRIFYDEETVAVPTIAFAEVIDSNESECEDYAVIDIEVKGGNVTPSEGEVVELVERKEFDALEGRVEDLEQRGGGGGNSDNNYTDADKALVQTIPSKVDYDTFNAFQENIERNIESLGEHLSEVGEHLVETKADKEGYYPAMSVGMADNLVGRGDVQDAHINFRPSAGADNITDGAARIERIKGNSVVWNQLVNMDSTSVELVAKRTYFTDINGEQSVRIISATTNIDVQFGRDKVVDLTQMFGTGNEPTTVEEYYQRKPMNIEDEYAYNAGTLVDMHANKIISTSDNAYDYTKHYARVMGGYKYDITANAGATLVVSFYADGEDDNEEREIAPDSEGKYTFPANGICYVNGDSVLNRDICVCLNHSYDKPHPAYQQEVKDLSFIGEAFPNGMRSAGSAYDEIRFNPTTKKWEAEKRIGVAKVGDLTWNHTNTEGQQRFTSYTLQNAIVPASDVSKVGNITSDKYTTITHNAMYNNANDMGISAHTGGSIAVKHLAYTDATTFKNEMADVTIYYELAKPIVVELDYPTAETNMDYLVWDFGTEEAIAPYGEDIKLIASAPFRADINYEPNAVDDIRWAVSEIRKLKAKLAQMQTSVTNLTE